MKRFSKTLVLLLAISLIIGSFGSIGVYADESVSSSANDISAIKLKKPKFSIKATSDKSGVKITTSKATYADGFYIYAKKDGAKKYSKVATISENGKKKRSITLKDLGRGVYTFKIKAYKGDTTSKYSKAKSVTLYDDPFEEKFETLLDVFYYQLLYYLDSPYDVNFLMLDAYVKSDEYDVDYIFKTESGTATPPDDVLENLKENIPYYQNNEDEDDKGPYIRCKTQDLLDFVENVLGQTIDIPEGNLCYDSFYNLDGYITEWDPSWYVSFTGSYVKFDNLKYTYTDDTVTVTFNAVSYLYGEIDTNEDYTLVWKKNSKSPIGYTLQSIDSVDLLEE